MGRESPSLREYIAPHYKINIFIVILYIVHFLDLGCKSWVGPQDCGTLGLWRNLCNLSTRCNKAVLFDGTSAVSEDGSMFLREAGNFHHEVDSSQETG
ncbi:hypothetical protein IC006_0250 [Sulfuracidifex tepidarius]|uniref:Uncharacterized protein n=1 Tax=Sulfuracidifex tepidarius TaxID=1294262 RepID=A0A510DZX3_9CREN|nr:hypothetical protein IC006_0250 [Sulfuracidifex tepidarius]BBG25727.1 hypothetical protein IC007_0232 [Sulfuracidifex tepidarius]